MNKHQQYVNGLMTAVLTTVGLGIMTSVLLGVYALADLVF